MTAPNRRGYDFDAINAQYPLIDEVRKHLPLKRMGKEWGGKCPFHADGTPSFMVNEQKGKFLCHGCGERGDVIDFVSKIKGISKADAIADLTGGKVAVMSEPVRQERDKLREQSEAQEERRKEIGTAEARREWNRAKASVFDHPYLVRKGITEIVDEYRLIRQIGDDLLIPMYGVDGEIQSVQTITPEGKKKFFTGAPVGLAHFNIGISMGRTIVCEGFATGASIWDAVPDQVCVTFSAGNMDKVARHLHARGVSIILAPDKDQAAHFKALSNELDCPCVLPVTDEPKGDFNDQYLALGKESVRATFDTCLRDYLSNAERAKREAERENQPLDLWARTPPPEFPETLLPPLIARFAKTRAEMVGCDASGIAMAALATCGALIRDSIRLRMKKHDKGWHEEARLWVMLVGDPSRKKTPILRATSGHLGKLDAELIATYNRELRDWNENGNHGPTPVPRRLRISDITMEAAAEVCAANPDGVLAVQDELSGWFGGIEKYSGGKGGAKDRAFWLQAFNGGHYATDRVGRKAAFVENLSVSIVGGVQPDPIRRIMADATDDGLIQRFFPIMLGEPALDKDVEMPDVAAEYDAMLDQLWALEAPSTFLNPHEPLTFSDKAQELRSGLAAEHLDMMVSFEGVNRKIASHIGKYDGLFGRLCLIFHCIEHVTENPDTPLGGEISEDTAKRAARFLHKFLRRHALAFYTNVAGLTNDHTIITDVAGYILAQGLDKVSLRTLARGTQAMRRLTKFEGHAIFEQLVAHGWLEETSMRSDATNWSVNPVVHEIYADRAQSEKARREDAREKIRQILND